MWQSSPPRILASDFISPPRALVSGNKHAMRFLGKGRLLNSPLCWFDSFLRFVFREEHSRDGKLHSRSARLESKRGAVGCKGSGVRAFEFERLSVDVITRGCLGITLGHIVG